MTFKVGDRVVSKSGKHGIITGTGKRGDQELVKVVYDQTPTEFLVAPNFLDPE